MSTKPTHILKVLNKTDESRGVCGAGWQNADGSISITINPAVYIVRDPALTYMLFPQTPQKKGEA